MKVIKVRATYRNHNYVGSSYVEESAVEAYKAWMQSKENKPLLFTEYNIGMESAENGSGSILCFTESGFNYNYRVK